MLTKNILIYNSLTRKKEKFIPLKTGVVKIYVCGPTVYGSAHLGHARTYIFFDLVNRYLKYIGYRVFFISNITDIHDSIIKEAKNKKILASELADKYTKAYFEDIKLIGLLKAKKYPRVTQNIKEIISSIKKILKNGYAYVNKNSVYFNIRKYRKYGELSGIKLKSASSGHRIDIDQYEKKNVADFVLWKAAKDNEPQWQSPWGKGRPGWHIECSSMLRKYLGDTADIHGGSIDLLFPHHENELAQAIAEKPKSKFVRYWMHTGPLMVGAVKMSRSLKNYVEIKEILKEMNPYALRMFVLSSHYRSPIEYNKKNIEQAKKKYEKIKNFLINLKNYQNTEKKNVDIKKSLKDLSYDILNHLNNDFNTPLALAAIFKFIKNINILIAKNLISKEDAYKIFQFFKKINKIFLFTDFSLLKFEERLPHDIIKLAKIREFYRKNKNWQKADKIREEIKKRGYLIEDNKKGSKIKTIQ